MATGAFSSVRHSECWLRRISFAPALGRRYAQYVNRFYNRSGSVWEGRFKASLIQAEEYLLTCYRYIELNPVRADMVRDPGDYAWSSYRCNGLGHADPLITEHPLYTALGADAPERQPAYRALFRAHLDEPALTVIRETINRRQPLGGAIISRSKWRRHWGGACSCASRGVSEKSLPCRCQGRWDWICRRR